MEMAYQVSKMQVSALLEVLKGLLHAYPLDTHTRLC